MSKSKISLESFSKDLNDILDLISGVYFDLAFNVSFLSTTPGTLTALNTKNFQLLTKRSKEISDLRDTLHDIKSEKIKLV